MTRSTQELRQETERSRAELAATVDQLKERISETAEDIRYKVSPQHLKSEVSELISDKTQGWVRSLKQQAKDHPMQAVAAGTAIAVPLLRLARGIPLPLLMIGAGLALTSKTVRDRAADAASPALQKAGDVLDETSERVRALSDDLKDGLASVQSQATHLGNDAAETLRTQAAQATGILGDKIRAGVAAAKNATANATAAVNSAAATAPAKARQVVGENAAVVGGLGIAVGAILAAVLPETKVEAKAMGRAGDHVKQAAGDAAQSALKTAKDAATSALDAAATKIAEADLGDHASRMTQTITDTLKDAADDVERAAFSTPRNPNV